MGKKKAIDYYESIKILKKAGFGEKLVKPIAVTCIPDVFHQISQLFKSEQSKYEGMLFFVMYDISNNKVRQLVAKYLLKKGCIRIQKSIYLANINQETYKIIHDDLAEVQSCYDNDDSILIIPIPSDYINSMKIIGHSIDTEVILGTKNTLFF